MFVVSRPSHLSTFFLFLGIFSLFFCLCSLFILPASHHHLPLSAQFFGLFSATHISSLSIHVGNPVDLSCIYFCSARGSDSQTRGVISCGCRSSLRSMLSMLPPACSGASRHQPSHYCSLYCSRTSSLRIVSASPLPFHET